MLSNKQISGFLDHQCLWNESIDFLDFLHYINQVKVACETTTFIWVRLGVSHIQYSQDNPSILKSPNSSLYCFYFKTGIIVKKIEINKHKYEKKCTHRLGILTLFDHGYSIFLFLFDYFLASVIKLNGGPFSYDLLKLL